MNTNVPRTAPIHTPSGYPSDRILTNDATSMKDIIEKNKGNLIFTDKSRLDRRHRK